MDTNDSQRLTTRELLDRFQLETAELPAIQVLNELQVVIERVSFTDLPSRSPQSTPEIATELDMLFDGEVSTNLLSFVHWLATREALGLLANESGDAFLNYCIKYFRNVKEVRFSTAVELSPEFRDHVSQQLRVIYPPPAKVVFNVVPSLVAGFIISVGDTNVDKSLRTQMQTSIRQRLDARSARSAQV